MINNAEAGTGPVWSTSGDPRITPVGKLLRDTHVDEFPQLFNVLSGAMSLVGPRPERPEIAAELETRIPAYRLRLMVRPGITGFAQVRLPADSELDGVRRKLAYDLFYIQHAGLIMDLKILLRTAVNFIWSVGGVTVTTARLPRREVVEKLVPYLLDESSARETFAKNSPRSVSETLSGHENPWHEATLASQ
jgi:lipopolysaccharide/colanic/teichoic acid biosynthesis glycosyltransferase